MKINTVRPDLLLWATSLCWKCWDDWQLTGVRLEPVDQNRLARGSHLQDEYLGSCVQDVVGAGVDGSKWWNSATSPHVHVSGLLQLL